MSSWFQNMDVCSIRVYFSSEVEDKHIFIYNMKKIWKLYACWTTFYCIIFCALAGHIMPVSDTFRTHYSLCYCTILLPVCQCHIEHVGFKCYFNCSYVIHITNLNEGEIIVHKIVP